jgi:predicted NAD/FAD-binding protein
MKRIAIVGSGIAGLTCAHYLSRRHQVRVFEANDYIGGHTHTVDVEWQGESSAIDTGFIVFNDRTYPHFLQLLEQLRVPYQPTEMSFSVRNDDIGLEYNGQNLNSLFAQRKNLVSPRFWKLLRDILVFNRQVREHNFSTSATVGDYLAAHNYGKLFENNYLLPMIGAIWSMGLQESRSLPLAFFVRFFANHGLLNLQDRPQWYSIIGGSRSYLEPLTAPFREQIELTIPVRRLSRDNGGVLLATDKNESRFDEVILACHADQALALLDQPTVAEQKILGALPFTNNQVTLHTDTRLLPRQQRAWASWNYYNQQQAGERATLTYNMNILQQLRKRHTYLVTLNQKIEQNYVLRRFNYAHPVYTPAGIRAQADWAKISGQRQIHYCGAYWFNGFHEDGVRSAQRVCRSLGVDL